MAPAGAYEIRVEPPRLARAQDKARAAAEQTLSEGRRLALQANKSSTQEALEKFKVARALFRDAEYPSGEGLSLVWIGDAYLQLENRTQPARDHYNEALALARALDDRWLEAEALLSLGISYPNVLDQPRALEYFEQALTLFEAVDNRRGQAVALTCIQIAWVDLGEYQKALEYAGRALALANAVDDRAQAARIHNSLGITYQRLGDLPKALEAHTQAIPLSRAGGALRLEFMALYNTGIVYKELGDYRRAVDYYNQSLARVRKLGMCSGKRKC